MLSTISVTAILAALLLIWALSGLVTLPVVPMLLFYIFDVQILSSNECYCYDSFVDCSARGKVAMSSTDFCYESPKLLDLSWNALVSTDFMCNKNGSVLCNSIDDFSAELEVFLVRGNNMVQFSAHGKSFPKLREMDISMNKLSDVFLIGLEKLETLNFSHNNLKILPWTNLNVSMPNIKNMDLSYNFISLKESDEFRFAKEIRNLNLSSNKISELYKHGIEGLINLENLDLSLNPLDIIDYDFSPIKNLKYLNLSQAGIYALKQETFNCLESLEVLDISDNNLIYLPKELFSHLVSLQYLDISHNQLMKIEFPKLNYQLQNFVKCNNSVSCKKKNQPLPGLRILNLSFNDIKGVKSQTFAELRKLRKLDLSNNALSYIMDDAFSMLEDLESLDLSHNELTSLPPDGAFAASKNLVHLDLSHNFLMSLGEGGVFAGLGSLRELKASWNFVADMTEGALAPLTQLQNLDLSWNVLRNAPGAAFRKLSALRYLNASYNQLKTFPDELVGSCRIQVWLTGNELATSSLSRSCAAQDRVSLYARLERAMYWPTAWLPPLPWAFLLASAVIFAAFLNRHLARRYTGLLVIVDS